MPDLTSPGGDLEPVERAPAGELRARRACTPPTAKTWPTWPGTR
jgi:hypothetical protein